jgi:hypothetical protein
MRKWIVSAVLLTASLAAPSARASVLEVQFCGSPRSDVNVCVKMDSAQASEFALPSETWTLVLTVNNNTRSYEMFRNDNRFGAINIITERQVDFGDFGGVQGLTGQHQVQVSLQNGAASTYVNFPGEANPWHLFGQGQVQMQTKTIF